MSNLIRGDIFKHNNVIRGNDDLVLIERRFTNFVLSRLTKESSSIKFTTKEISEALGYEVTDWSNIVRLVDGVDKKMIKFKSEDGSDIACHIFNYVQYKDGIYNIELQSKLTPYLLDFKDNKKGCFTTFSSSLLQQFKFKHTQRTYELLKSWLNIKEYKYSVSELKYQLNVPNMATPIFFRDILTKAVAEINDKSDILVEYTKDTSTKTINYLMFTIKPNPNYKKPTSEVAQKPLQEVKPVNNTPIVKQEVKTPIKASEPVKSSLTEKLNFISEQYLNMPETNIDELRLKFRTMRDILMNLKNSNQQIELKKYVDELQSRIK